jgi:CRISPR-associated protein Csd1
MGGMQILQETYQKARDYIGRTDPKGCILLPIAHSTQNAQIEIVIGLNGELKSARKVEKSEAVTIIPVTEDSGSRSNGVTPHPLCDKLCYVAGDYEKFSEKKKAEEFYGAYIEQLEKWVQSGCHKYVKAVYSYVKKKCMIQDLLEQGILILGDDGKLEESIKLELIPQTDSFVRFRIQDEEVLGLGEVWKEQAVYEDYIQYYLGLLKEKDLDYITGKQMACSGKHPSKIRNSGDKAKLISANDNTGFTFRGRSRIKEEAVSVGYISSQEAHNALRWLIDRQGYKQYDMCMVTWNPELEEVPEWLRCDTYDAVYAGEDNFNADFGENYNEQITNAIKGRYSYFEDPLRQIVVMALDAATTGRLSITYFQEMRGSDFLNNLIYWYSSCCWRMSYRKEKIYWNKPMTPTPEDIVRAAYGVERNGILQVKNPLMKDTLRRLTPCIIAGRIIPIDIVKAAFENACKPQNYESYNRRKVLEIACALIQKNNKDRNKNLRGEFESMSLNRGNRNRDYLYGRLLAVAHKLEYDTYTDEEKGKRLTNAERYRTMLIRNPQKAWLEISKKLQPYERKISLGQKIIYQKEFQEIYDAFKEGDYTATEKLGVEVLLGYHCQLSELWNIKNKAANENQTTGGTENE